MENAGKFECKFLIFTKINRNRLEAGCQLVFGHTLTEVVVGNCYVSTKQNVGNRGPDNFSNKLYDRFESCKLGGLEATLR